MQWLKACLGWLRPPRFTAPVLPAAAPPMPALPEPLVPTIADWHALPGFVIELGRTGFAITFNEQRNLPVYTATDPEGRIVAWGADVEGLKRMCERLATDRQQFAWTPR